MRRALLLAALLTIPASGQLAAEDASEGPKFKRGVPTDAIRFVAADSEDGRASTMIFDNFQVATDASRTVAPDISTRTFTFVRKIDSTSDSCVELDFRGFVSRSGVASASMIVHTGGKTTVVDLKKAIQTAKENTIDLSCPVRKKAQEAADESGFDDAEGEADDFAVFIAARVPKGQTLQTTVILLVERTKEGDEESGATLVVDSIDCEVEAAPGKEK